MVCMIPRYLFTEWEDPTFGARASCVHAALVDSLTSATGGGGAVWEAIRRQTDMVSQLAYIVKELKVGAILMALQLANPWGSGRAVAINAKGTHNRLCTHARTFTQHTHMHSTYTCMQPRSCCRCRDSRRYARQSGYGRCCLLQAHARSLPACACRCR